MIHKYYLGGMKVKTSITLSDYVLEEINELASPSKRSYFIEQAILAYIEKAKRHKRDANDLKLINHSAAKLNKKAGDVLEFQVKL